MNLLSRLYPAQLTNEFYICFKIEFCFELQQLNLIRILEGRSHFFFPDPLFGNFSLTTTFIIRNVHYEELEIHKKAGITKNLIILGDTSIFRLIWKLFKSHSYILIINVYINICFKATYCVLLIYLFLCHKSYHLHY